MAKGYSVHYGLQYTSKDGYPRPLQTIESAKRDAENMANIALQNQFSILHEKPLLSQNATIDQFIDDMIQLSKDAISGDLVFISFSGHGTRLPDLNGDEIDFCDEAICLYDGYFMDDRIFDYLCKFDKGVRILFIADCCFSGTMAKPDAESKDEKIPYIRTKRSKRKLKASVLLMASTSEDDIAFSGTLESPFGAGIREVLNYSPPPESYQALYEHVLQNYGDHRRPTIFHIGPNVNTFLNQKPFII